MAGSVESGDIMVTLEPAEKLDIVIKSKFIKQYGTEIKQIVETVCQEQGVTAGNIIINDQGAIPGVIRARVLTALGRLEVK